MPKQIDKACALALKTRIPFKGGNTVIREADGLWYMTLHGSDIAALLPDDTLCVTLAGYNTVTTRSRLNGAGVPVSTKKFKPYIGTTPIESDEWYVTVPGESPVAIRSPRKYLESLLTAANPATNPAPLCTEDHHDIGMVLVTKLLLPSPGGKIATELGYKTPTGVGEVITAWLDEAGYCVTKKS